MTDKHTRTFEIEVTSPYGNQPIEQFRHFVKKVSDEASERWGITIEVSEQTETTEKTEFETAN